MAGGKHQTDWPMQAVCKAPLRLPRNSLSRQNHSSFSLLLTPFPPRCSAELSRTILILCRLPSILVGADLTCLTLEHVRSRPPPAPSQLNVRLRAINTYSVRRKAAHLRAKFDIAHHGRWLIEKQHDRARLPSRLLLHRISGDRSCAS